MANDEQGPFRVAVLAASGVDVGDVSTVKSALESAGAEVLIVSPVSDVLTGAAPASQTQVEVDRSLFETDSSAYEALFVPGGIESVDALRAEPKAAIFVRGFIEAQKPLGAAGHGAWMLIDAGGAAGRRLTSAPSIQVDVINAGGDWSDAAIVQDDMLVTSRGGENVAEFVQTLVKVWGLS